MRGKLTVGLLFAVGFLAAAFAWWHGFQRGRRVLALWGADKAAVMRYQSQLELAELRPATDPAKLPTIRLGDTIWQVERPKDITRAPGVVHARQALIDDPSYDWGSPPPPLSSAADWKYLLTFRRDGQTVQLAFAPAPGWLIDVESQQVASIAPIRQGLQKFCAEQFTEDAETGPR